MLTNLPAFLSLGIVLAFAGVAELEKEELRREERGDLKGALEIAQRIHLQSPNDHRNLNVIAGLYGKMQRFDDEITWANKALAKAPGYWQARVNLGNAYLGKSDLERARAAFLTAAEVAPRDPLPAYSLGLVEEAKDNIAGALVYYRHSVELDPRFESGLFNSAAMQANLGCLPEAKRLVRKVLALNAKAEGAADMLAQIERDMKKGGGRRAIGNPFFDGLRSALERGDNRRIEQAARALAATDGNRTPGIPVLPGIEELEALAIPMCIDPASPSFRKLVDEWKRARGK